MRALLSIPVHTFYAFITSYLPDASHINVLKSTVPSQLLSTLLDINYGYIVMEVEVNLRPTVSRPVCLVSGAHLGPMTNFSFFSKFHSDSCVFVIL
jgi:hypothetical protein